MRAPLDFGSVLRAAQATAPTAVVDVVAAAAREAGATDVVAYIVDFEQQVLEPLPDRATHVELPVTEQVAGTMAGRAFLTCAPVTAERDGGVRVWVPVIEGSDRTGVLAMTVPAVDDQVLRQCLDLGTLTGYLIATHTRTTDLYQLHRRRKAMSLAASMQWDLLPPLVLRTPGCGVAALLEPAYEVGGDSFDYAVNGEVVDLALIDAMGHGVGASSIASLVIGCYRHGRREGRTPEAIHGSLDDVLQRQYGGEVFATGQLAQLTLKTGELAWTNAGHPAPLLIRNGRVIKQLESEPTLPWGLGGPPPGLARESLEPDDAVLFYTDGVVEARTETGEEFGLDRLADLASQYASHQLAPAEVVRQIVRSVLDHRAIELRDDATLMLVQWHRDTP
ncbi:MAG TPA: PP2C family protein-serine/threonine phosphatase [Mycobacteriales bacterium]|nr:PP2C family protein-serine/threonine phosphatase [Mycobacteriales bacterium]